MMMAARLTTLSKVLTTVIVLGASGFVPAAAADKPTPPAAGTASAPAARGKRTYKVALATWPGHMPLVIGNGGLTTQPGSAAAAEGIDLQIVFIEEPLKKNAALQAGNIDFVWQTVDELPINMGGFKSAKVDGRVFLQLDWSRGGDACVASKEIQKVEDLLGRKAAMMMFSPDHTLFEFMVNNARFTAPQIEKVRKDTSFSMDDVTYGRVLFNQGKVDLACVWEPDVTLALKGRPGAHLLFSTVDATELVADVLLARQELLTGQADVAEKVARVYFAGIKSAEADKPAAARLVLNAVPRFRDELGYDKTLKSFDWVKWTDLGDNAAFFGLEGKGAAFDRVYKQADAIWTKYPQAEIKDRFVPTNLRNDGAVRKLWDAAGRKALVKETTYQPKIASTGAPVFTKPVTIKFASGSHQLDAPSMSVLKDQLLPQLQMARGMYIRVEGNTDNVGDKESNAKLSEQRAQAIVDYLVKRGAEPARVVAKGNGDGTPVSDNKTPAGRASNRRTDILFISGTGAGH
jgi:outer membrane protein OmpA-like peptidoglycan-associated protein/ABC-type nitrate/sulfonate/bicarbonate transport system substrate-binding protein